MGTNRIQKIFFSFSISAICGLLTNLIIEIIVRQVTGDINFLPVSAEYAALFLSDSIAMEVNALLYGLIGATFSAATCVYEWEKIGFLLQNLVYFMLTGIVWIPIVLLIWQLILYPQALIGTLSGFAATYVVMTYIGYRITKKDVHEINKALLGNDTE